MKIKDYPKTIKEKEQYSSVDLAIIFGVSHRTATQMVDKHGLPGFKYPGGRERRTMHVDLVKWCDEHPECRFILKRIVPAKLEETHGQPG